MVGEWWGDLFKVVLIDRVWLGVIIYVYIVYLRCFCRVVNIFENCYLLCLVMCMLFLCGRDFWWVKCLGWGEFDEWGFFGVKLIVLLDYWVIRVGDIWWGWYCFWLGF